MRARLGAQLGRIRVRLLLVNLLLVLIPPVGLELAATYEKEMLGALEEDMRNQAVLVRRVLEGDLEEGVPLDAAQHQRAIERAARTTRTRVRVFGGSRRLLLDSHRDGPPEGPEPPAPALVRSPTSWPVTYGEPEGPRWPEAVDREEVRRAFRGERSSYTRVRARDPAVLLFVAEPVFASGRVVGVVYAVRSTVPVLEQLHRLRQMLFMVMAGALAFTVLLTVLLAWTISRPLGKLAATARRIAAGERDLPVPIEGSGEVRDLGEAFAEMTAQLRRRLRYISEFAADVAHEFKSPLTSIRGAAELLDDGAADDATARARFLGNILEDTRRLDRLVSRLLELSRLESTEAPKTDVDLGALVARVAAELRGKGAAIDARAPEGLVAHGRALDLELAVRNLLDNALRFSPEGAPVEALVEQRGREAFVSVLDRGPGVPPSHRERVFERFFTTDEARKGTGLGLAIVRTVAETHGGAAFVEPREGGGAAFRIRLPLR